MRAPFRFRRSVGRWSSSPPQGPDTLNPSNASACSVLDLHSTVVCKPGRALHQTPKPLPTCAHTTVVGGVLRALQRPTPQVTSPSCTTKTGPSSHTPPVRQHNDSGRSGGPNMFGISARVLSAASQVCPARGSFTRKTARRDGSNRPGLRFQASGSKDEKHYSVRPATPESNPQAAPSSRPGDIASRGRNSRHPVATCTWVSGGPDPVRQPSSIAPVLYRPARHVL